MICHLEVRVLSTEGHDERPDRASADLLVPNRRLSSSVRRAIGRARQWLLGQQQTDGNWLGEWEGDATATSEYVLLLAFLEREESASAHRAAQHLIDNQRPDGGWSAFPGGPVEVCISTKAYFALKLTGHDPSSDSMQRAQAAILTAGGADAVDGPTRCFLALMGQIPYDGCPAAATNAIRQGETLAPLSTVCFYRPVREIDPRRGIRELFIRRPIDWPELCIHDLPADVDGSSPSFHSIVWRIFALRSLGHADDSPELEDCHRTLADMIVEEADTLRIVPRRFPLRDTALSLRALAVSGLNRENPQVGHATRWLLEVTSVRTTGATDGQASSGTHHALKRNDECAKLYTPDVHDAALALLALSEFSNGPIADALPATLGLLESTADYPTGATAGLSGSDGCRDRKALLLASLNVDVQSSPPDLTARVLEALAAMGKRIGDPAVDRAIDCLRDNQEADGSWIGRLGVHRIHGTWQVIAGLTAAGLSADDPAVAAGVNWLLAHQQPSGGWGESPDFATPPELRGRGAETPSQTAWAVLALVAAGLAGHPAAVRGVRFLEERQQSDGAWQEAEFTSVDYPRASYLRCHLDAAAFPLLALSRWAVAVA